jgi:hypothetical protein
VIESTRSSQANRIPPAASAKRRSGNEVRYRLTPHARMTISSLLLVSNPIVISVASRTEMARM